MIDRYKYSSINRFPVLLRGAWFGMNRVFRERLKNLGITTSQYTALRCLHENEGINQSVLSKRISTNKNNCSALVNRLHKQELIQKEVIIDDRRNYNLNLTKKGKEIFSKADDIACDLQKEVLGELPLNAETALVSLLRKIEMTLSEKFQIH